MKNAENPEAVHTYGSLTNEKTLVAFLYSKGVDYTAYATSSGVHPVVCLKSSISAVESDGGYSLVK